MLKNLAITKRLVALSLMVVAILMLGPQKLIGAPLRIVYITPAAHGNPYWTEVFEYMNKAAADLDIVFEHMDLGTVDRYSINEVAKALMMGPNRPSALIVAVAYGNTIPLLELAELYHIPVVVQGFLFPQELNRIGREPRNQFKYWIASLEQDEELKAYLSATALLKKTVESVPAGSKKKIRVLALEGVARWKGQSLRFEGFERALLHFPEVELVQSIQVPWMAEKSRALTKKLLTRHKDIHAIWCATDLIAQGAATAAEEKGYKVGKNIFLSGIDLSRNGLSLMAKDKIVATSSAPAPFFGLALVMLHDYLKGQDFKLDFGTVWSPEIVFGDKSNALQITRTLNDFKRVDFKKYSKFYHGDTFSYEKRFYEDFYRMSKQPLEIDKTN